MRIGIDVGGTKTAAMTFDAGGAPVAERRLPTPVVDYAALLEALDDLGEGGARVGGIAIPGTPDPRTGLVKNCNFSMLNGRPLGADLASRWGRAVPIANDGACFALSEARGGAGEGAGSVFGVVLGTGVGGGLVIGGRLHEGANGLAGEWGHMPFPWACADEPLPDCYCGRRGCVETMLSGGAFRALGEDVAAYRDRLARALAVVVGILDPEVIVLGGGLSLLEGLADGLEAQVARHAFDAGGKGASLVTRIRLARFGDASGARGAALLEPAGMDRGAG